VQGRTTTLYVFFSCLHALLVGMVHLKILLVLVWSVLMSSYRVSRAPHLPSLLQARHKDSDSLSEQKRFSLDLQKAKQATLSFLGVAMASSAGQVCADEVLDNLEQVLSPGQIAQEIQNQRPLCSDEFQYNFTEEALGIGLSEANYKGFPVTTVSKIVNEELLKTVPELREGAVITTVNGVSVDGQPMKSIASSIQSAGRPVTVRFRDPSRFFQLLDSAGEGKPQKIITTSYLPANARDAGAAEQIVQIQRLALPPADDPARLRSTKYLDAMEIQYVCQLSETQLVDLNNLNDSYNEDSDIVDSSAARAPPGTSAKSIYYVLGQGSGPIGFKPPPGWDIALRGMVVGERRRIILPYTLGYERKGSKDGKIPPFATLIYTVKLLSIS
jgi:hypothetical protein